MTNPSPAPEGVLDELLTDFLDEATQLLDKLNEDLLVLDAWVAALTDAGARCDEALMNNMFRSAHSIKGLSAMLGLNNINRLTHRVENVFDAARKAELALDRQVVQTIFEAVDQLSAMVALLRAEGHDNHDAEPVIESIQRILQAANCERQATSQADAERALAPDPPPAPAAIDTAPPPVSAAASLFGDIADEAEIPAKYLAILIDETELSLDAISETLLGLEGCDMGGAIENLLITSHRIKGSAASVGLHRPAKLAHLMEDILQELRETGRPLRPAMAEVLLHCADTLRLYVNGLKEGRAPDIDFQPLATELLLAHAAESHSGAPSAPAATGTATTVADPLVVLRGYAQRYAAHPALVVGYVRFAPQLALAGLKAQLIYEKLHNSGELLEGSPPECGVDELDAIDVLMFAMVTEIPPAVIQRRIFVAGVAEARVFDAATILEAMPAASAGVSPTSPALEAAGEGDAAASKGRATEAGRPSETLRVDIERLDQLMNLAGQLVINKARFAQIGEGIKETMFGKQTPQLVAGAANLSRKLLAAVDRDDLATIRSHARRLAADLEAVQRELARVSHMRSRVNDLFEAVHQLDRVADGIQKSVMDTRMVPIGPLFGRFKRVVRDITRLNNKEINLSIRGEKTELDKRMIDELGDPLIHMVRNAADHGIEAPAARIAAGKPAQGTLTLDAFHRGNSIIIQVADDGKGLDKDRILAKALEKKLITPAEAEKMTPQQVYQLIWEPGFSTAEKITEISGRGMGMDIVRSKIEEISGTVEVDSRPGQGTTFTIKLPLTLAILPSLMAEIDGDVFALPVEAIVEIVSVPPSSLATVHGSPTAVIRGRVVSIVELTGLFTWNRPPKVRREREASDTLLVILGQEGREIGLKVDSLLGEEDVVIKSMAENYRNVAGIAGASILGDGRVSLILDVAALIGLSGAARTAAEPTRTWEMQRT